MPVENVTENRGYQLPYASNDLADDVVRIIAAITGIDLDVANALVAIAGKAAATHGHIISDTTGLQGALDAKQDASAKGAANGYAGLDATGKVPTAQLPAAVLGALSYQGLWNANTNSPTIPAAEASNKGYYYKVGTAGSTNVGGETDWKVGDWIVSNGSAWDKVDNTDLVTAVAGLVGNISASALKTALTIAAGDITDASANGRSLIQAANYATMFGLLKQAATTSASGVVELATNAEAIAGTDGNRAVTPAALQAKLDETGGGSYEYVGTQVASASSSLLFDSSTTGALAAGYDYVVSYDNLQLSTDGYVLLQYGTGVGPTYQTTGYQSRTGSTMDASTSGIASNESGPGGGSANEIYDGELVVKDVGENSRHVATGVIFGFDSGGNRRTSIIGGWRTTSEVLTGLRLVPSSGNIASGKATLWRRKRS